MLSSACLAIALALGAAPASPPAAAPTAPPAAEAVRVFHGRGVNYADASAKCALAALGGSRGDHACLRIALDDESSTVTVDPQKHVITVQNATSYPSKTLIGDVLLPGWSTASGARSPAAAHLMIYKKGDRFSTKVHAHAASQERATKVELEAYEVVTSDDGKKITPALTVEQAQKAVEDPGLSARLAEDLVEVADNLKLPPAGGVAALPNADITISIGVGPAAKKVARAQLFRSGTDSELRVTALSGLIPKDVIRRDLFLYGVEDQPILAEVKKRGLKSGETLQFTVKGGQGTVTFGGASAPFPGAADATRSFLEGSFVGVLLAHQAHLDSAG